MTTRARLAHALERVVADATGAQWAASDTAKAVLQRMATEAPDEPPDEREYQKARRVLNVIRAWGGEADNLAPARQELEETMRLTETVMVILRGGEQ